MPSSNSVISKPTRTRWITSSLHHSITLLFLLAILLPLPASAQTHAKSVRLAICQILVIDSDREGNFRRIEYALEQAESQHAQIAVFPESSILGWENPDAHRLASPIPAVTVTASPLSPASTAS